MEVVGGNTLLPGDPRLIDHIVHELKSQGIFDQFRKECIADVDTKPAYQNLRQRVEGSVTGFLKTQNWRPDMNKNQLREMLRKNIYESGFLETGVERIVDQVVNPKINTVFLPQVEEVVYKFLGLAKPTRNATTYSNPLNGPLTINTVDLLPTDLDPISPDSEFLLDKTQKPEKSSEVEEEEVVPENLDDSKNDEFESPPFEPITEQTVYEAHDESSNDSRISGISGLTSHDSNMSEVAAGVTAAASSAAGPDVNNQDSQLSKVSSNSRLSIVTTSSKHASEKMDISDDNTEDCPVKIEENTSLIGMESEVKVEVRDELEEIRMEINGHLQQQNNKENINTVVQEEIKSEIKDEDVKTEDITLKTENITTENENITIKTENITIKTENITLKTENLTLKEEISTPVKEEIKEVEIKQEDKTNDGKKRHDSEKRKHSDKDRKEDKKSDKDKEDKKSDKDKDDKKSDKDKDKDKKDKYKSSSSRDKDRHREKSRDNKSSSKDKDKDKDKDKSKSSSSSKHSSRDRTSKSSDTKSSKDSSKSTSKSSSSSGSKRSENSSSKSRSRDHSKHSHSSSSKDRKSSSSSSKDCRKKDEKKSTKRDQDDHSSSRDKKSDTRRSADRDSNDGSSSVNTTTAPATQKDNSASTSSTKSNSDFSGSNSGDSGQSDSIQNNPDTITMNEETLNEVALNPSMNPVVTLTKMKKPKIASNIFEVRKLMKIRKKMEKMEKKRQRQHELISENNTNKMRDSPISLEDTDSVDSQLTNTSNNLDELTKNIASITGEDLTSSDQELEASNTAKTAIVSKESWDAIEAKLSQSAHENVDFNAYAEDTGDSSSNSNTKQEEASAKRSKRLSEEEDCLYFNSEVSPTTERFLQSIETFRKLQTNNMEKMNMLQQRNEKKPQTKGKKRKIDGEIDTENNNKKAIAGEVNDVLDTLTASPSGSNLSNGSLDVPIKPKSSRVKKTKKTVNCSPSSDIDSAETIGETKRISRASILKNQRYSSDDLYKPRPIVSGSSRRQRGLLNNTDKKN